MIGRAKGLSPPKPGVLAVHVSRQGLGFAFFPEVCEYHPYSKPEEIPNLLSTFVLKHGLQGMPTTLILDKMDYRLVYLDAPELSDEELGAASKWLVKDYIDFPLELALVDAFKLPVHEGHPKKLYAVVTKLERIKYLIQLFAQADLVVSCIDIPELALRNVISKLNKAGGELALLYLQPDFQALLVSQGSELCFSRNLDTYLSYQDPDPEADPHAIEKLISELERSLKFYSTQHRQDLPKTLYLTTGLPREIELIDGLTEEVKVAVSPVEIQKAILLDKRCLIALGGTLRSTEQPQAINLFKRLPVEKVNKKYINDKTLIGMMALTGVLLLGVTIHKLITVHQLNQDLKRLEIHQTGSQQTLEALKVTFPEATDASLEKKNKEKEERIAAKQKLLELLNQSSGTNGYSAKLEALAETISPDTWLTSITLNDIDTYVALTGKAQSSEGVFRFVDNLGTNSEFTDIKFQTFTVTGKDKNTVSFVLSNLIGQPPANPEGIVEEKETHHEAPAS